MLDIQRPKWTMIEHFEYCRFKIRFKTMCINNKTAIHQPIIVNNTDIHI